MDYFNVFLDHPLQEARERVCDMLQVNTRLTVCPNTQNFSFLKLLEATFDIIPDNFLPLVRIVYLDAEDNEKVLEIDRAYIYEICKFDIMITSRFYYKNTSDIERCSYSSLWSENDRNKHRKRQISEFRKSPFFKLFNVIELKNGYSLPKTYSQLIKGMVISSKNNGAFFKAEESDFSVRKCKNFYRDISECENSYENLHLVEQLFSVSLFRQIASIVQNAESFGYNKYDLIHAARQLNKLPNVIGRQRVVSDFLSMRTIQDIYIENELPSALSVNRTSWIDCISYICFIIARRTYPVWESLFITQLDTLFDSSAEILASPNLETVSSALSELFDLNGSKITEFGEKVFADLCNEVKKGFFANIQYEKYETESRERLERDKRPVRALPKVEPSENDLYLERKYMELNYRSIFFQESLYNNIDPFNPWLTTI